MRNTVEARSQAETCCDGGQLVQGALQHLCTGCCLAPVGLQCCWLKSCIDRASLARKCLNTLLAEQGIQLRHMPTSAQAAQYRPS